ncbi:MAG TPA: hypothetical protein VKS21_06905, partial [Spirochaetota bacterium]|nr:hypothetical protein [Spirochaetota bacterium]
MKTFKKFGIITVCCLVLTAACKDGDNPAENSDPVSYNLTVLVSPNTAAGSVLKMPDKTAYSSGTEVTLAAQANAGYLFDSWSGELGSSSNTVQL